MTKKEGCLIFIKNETLNKYIFILRDNIPTIPYPNTWSILGGGIEDGETPLDAILREVEEELNVDLYDIREIHTMDIHSEIQGKINTITGYFFFAKTKTEDLSKIPLKEGQKASFFSIEEINNIDNIPPFINTILKMCEKDE